jgi:hypothetical protein
MTMPDDEAWYTEVWPDRTAPAPSTVRMIADFASARSVIQDRRPGEVVRIKAPRKATSNQLLELRNLGAKLIF